MGGRNGRNRLRTIVEDMRTTRLSNAICCLLAGILYVSCSKELPGPAGNEYNGTACFGIDTRATDATAGTTYRIMAYGADKNASLYKFQRTGTYYLKTLEVPEGEEVELTACSLSDDGTNPQDNETSGLNGSYGNFYLVFVSPGVKHNEDGSFSFAPTKGKFLASFPEQKSLGGYGRHVMKNPLQDQRAKVGFKFYKWNNVSVEDFTIDELGLTGAGADGESVKLYPASRQVIAGKEAGMDITLDRKENEQEKNEAGDILRYTTNDENFVFIASAIYAPLDEVAEQLGVTYYKDHLVESDYLYMTCKLSQGSRKNIPIRMPLTGKFPELEPQHTYVFNITVKSSYLSATVDVFSQDNNDWQEGGNESGTISNPDYTVKLGTWEIVGTDDDWQLVKIEEQTIGKP